MKMVDLQMSKKEAKESTGGMAARPSDSLPKYPYGTQLDFNSEILDKIPALKKMDVGEYVVVRAVAKVQTKNENNTAGEKKRFNMTLQIEQIAIDKRDDAQAAFDEAVNDKPK